MTWNEYNRLKRIVDAELVITENNVLKKSLDTPYLYHKYLDIFTKETKELKELNKRVTELYSKLYKKYKYEGDFQLDSKAEVETFIHGEQEYMNLKHEADIQEIILQYLENLMDAIGRTSFSIKNFIEYSKFLAGK